MKTKLKDCPVIIAQNEKEWEPFMDWYASKKNIKNLLEIGTYCGGSLYYFITENSKLEKVVSIDLPAEPTQFQKKQNKNKIKDFTKGIDLLQIQGDCHFPSTINQIPNIRFDLIFMDAVQLYETVKLDFNNYKNFLNVGGYMVIHSTGYVDKFIDEIRGQYNIIEFGSIKVVEM